MAAKQLLFHSQAHAKFLAGMGILANAVRATLGPKAWTVMIARIPAKNHAGAPATGDMDM